MADKTSFASARVAEIEAKNTVSVTAATGCTVGQNNVIKQNGVLLGEFQISKSTGTFTPNAWNEVGTMSPAPGRLLQVVAVDTKTTGDSVGLVAVYETGAIKVRPVVANISSVWATFSHPL